MTNIRYVSQSTEKAFPSLRSNYTVAPVDARWKLERGEGEIGEGCEEDGEKVSPCSCHSCAAVRMKGKLGTVHKLYSDQNNPRLSKIYHRLRHTLERWSNFWDDAMVIIFLGGTIAFDGFQWFCRTSSITMNVFSQANHRITPTSHKFPV